MKILSLLQFTTILPLGKSQDLEYFARHSYLYPVAGYVIGALVALPVFFIADSYNCCRGCHSLDHADIRCPSF